jgi:hypothetical protein
VDRKALKEIWDEGRLSTRLQQFDELKGSLEKRSQEIEAVRRELNAEAVIPFARKK